MALSNQQKQDILSVVGPLIAQEGSLQSVMEQTLGAYANAQTTSALSDLSSVASATITSWPGLTAFLNTGISPRLVPILGDKVQDAITAQNANSVFRLLLAYYAAAKAHFGQ